MKKTRRDFISNTSKLSLATALFSYPLYACANAAESKETVEVMTSNDLDKSMFFKISLAQWSLNKAFFSGELDHLDFAKKTVEDFEIDAIEYVNQFFKDKANDKTYLDEMNKRANDHGVTQLLIMVDGEGGLGDLDDSKRKEAVENHYKWVEAAKHLGCHSIRVNAYGEGSAEEVAKAAVDGLGSLATFAKDYDLNVIVENHGGYSSDGSWLSGVMTSIDLPNCGTLPDFGNFCLERDPSKPWAENCIKEYDRYQGVEELMRHAKAVSAKTHDFGPDGSESHTDYMKMMKIVQDAGYKGYVGIEYEGSSLSADEGILATKRLLEKVGNALSG